MTDPRTEQEPTPSDPRVRRALAAFVEAPIGLCAISPDVRITHANAAFQELFGYTEEELRSLDILRLLPPEEHEALRRRAASIIEGAVDGYQGERQYLRRDGSRVWLRVSMRAVRKPDGSLDFAIGLAEDVSDRVRNERRAFERDQITQAVMNSTRDVAFVVEAGGTLTAINEAGARRFGGTPGELVGRNVFDAVRSPHSVAGRDACERAAATGLPVRVESVVGEHVIEINTYPIPDRTGRVTKVAVLGTDVTAIRRAEAELRQSEERFRLLVELSVDGVVVVGRDGTLRFANPAAEAILGRREVGGPCGTFPHPIEPGLVSEVALTRPDGRRVTCEMRAVEATLHGEPVDIVSLRDITALVASREEMRTMTMVDDLTGLYNRRGLLALGRQQVAFAQRSRRALLVLYADLDCMKWINDTHGHAEGDRAIEAAAEVLRDTFRRSDVIARVGGDEFAVLSLEVTPGAIDVVSARLDAALAAYNSKGLRPYPLSLSVGASYYDPEAPCSVEDLLDRADSLMYQRKRERRPTPIQNTNTTTS